MNLDIRPHGQPVVSPFNDSLPYQIFQLVRGSLVLTPKPVKVYKRGSRTVLIQRIAKIQYQIIYVHITAASPAPAATDQNRPYLNAIVGKMRF